MAKDCNAAFGRTLFVASIFLLCTCVTQAKEYLVKWKSLQALHDFHFRIKKSSAYKILEKLERAQISKIEIRDFNKNAIPLLLNPELEYLVENKKLESFSSIKNTNINYSLRTADQWALLKTKAASAWSLAQNKGSRSVLIAVIDSGVDTTHESLSDNLIAGYDFKDNDSDPTDETGFLNPGHGTHCAGVAGATGKMSEGVAGMSPVVSIMPIRFLGKNAQGTMDDAIQSIDYAVEKGARVISASWGGSLTPLEARPLIEAVQRASDAGVLFVTSAGNGDENAQGFSNENHDVYPANANFQNTITVAASDEADQKTKFSNFGATKVQVAAPGLDILSSLPRNHYAELSGTSMAAPLVAGLAAFLMAQAPSLSAEAIKEIILSTGDTVDIETECHCRINAEAAIKKILEKTY